MNIRQFIEADREVVIQLWSDCDLTRPWNDPSKDIDRKMTYQPQLFFVGEINGDVMASAMLGYDGHRGALYYFAIHPDQQGKGYGRGFMEYLEEKLQEIGCPKLNLLVRTTNLQVTGFYEQLEYKEDDVVSLGKRFEEGELC